MLGLLSCLIGEVYPPFELLIEYRPSQDWECHFADGAIDGIGSGWYKRMVARRARDSSIMASQAEIDSLGT